MATHPRREREGPKGATARRARERSSKCDANRIKARAHALSQMNKPLMRKQRRAQRKTHARRRRTESVNDARAPALGCSQCNYSWQTTTPEGSHARSIQESSHNASTRGHHAVSHQTTRAPRVRKGREPKPGVLTRESYRLAIHIVKPHNRFTHCPDRRLVRKRTDDGRVAGRDGPRNRSKRKRLDARRRKTNRSEARWGLSRSGLDHHNRDDTQAHSGTLNIRHRKSSTQTCRKRAHCLPVRARCVRPAGAHKTATARMLALLGSRLGADPPQELRAPNALLKRLLCGNFRERFPECPPALKVAAARNGAECPCPPVRHSAWRAADARPSPTAGACVRRATPGPHQHARDALELRDAPLRRAAREQTAPRAHAPFTIPESR